MYTFRTFASILALIVAFGFNSNEALAQKQVTTDSTTEATQTTLSGKEALNLAKSYLPLFLEVDPSITLRELKHYILSLNTTDLTEIDSAIQSYLLSLQPASVNQAPSISGNPVTEIIEGDSYSFTPVASDPDGDSLTFSIANKPAWATFDGTTGSLNGTPQVGSAGSYGNIVISVSDGELSDALPAFAILVNPTVTAGAPTLLSAEVSAADVVLTWIQENSVPEGGYDVFVDGADTGPLYRTTATSQAISGLDLTQAHCFTVEARYTNTSEFFPSNQLCSEAQLPPNQAPSISGNPLTEIIEGDSYSFTPVASDPDGDSLTFSIANKPAWATFDSGTGTLSGTPLVGSADSYGNIVISVSDGELSDALPAFAILVNPTVAAGAPTLLSAEVSAADVVLTWIQENSVPEGGYDIFVDGADTGPLYRTTATSQAISGLDLTQAHCFTVEARYTNTSEFFPSNQLCSEAQLPPNQAPSINGNPATMISEGDSYSFTPVASDPEGDSLTFSIANKPAWATFDSGTGRLSGTPQVGSAGSYGNILISVSDGALSDALPAFAILVNPTVAAGAPTLLSAEVSAADVILTWIQENSVPEGGYDVFIDGVDTGPLYRTTSTSLAISGLDLTQAHCFTVEARYTNTSEFFASNQVCSEAQTPTNQPPVISGTPSTEVLVGDSYLFSPISSDADGDTLSFTIFNAPAWASFDNQTGSLSGTPQVGDEGSYADIEIRVSDGQASVSLAPFTLVVGAVQSTGSATLSWVPPATRADGSSLSLSEIDGYRIYMGDSESALEPVMDINDNSVTQYTLSNIAVGDHFYSITAYDVDGQESDLSNIVSRSTL